MMRRSLRYLASLLLRLRLHLRRPPLLRLLWRTPLRLLRELRLTLELLSHEPVIQFAMSALRQWELPKLRRLAVSPLSGPRTTKSISSVGALPGR